MSSIEQRLSAIEAALRADDPERQFHDICPGVEFDPTLSLQANFARLEVPPGLIPAKLEQED